MGFGQGLSGLNAAAQSLDVIGNNVANAGTAGFKAGSASFADVYATSRIGLGVQVAGVNQRFTSGSLEMTGNQYDMAIDGGTGFFRLLNTSGEVVYSRNGQFIKDENNYIVNAQGMRLTGYPPDSVVDGVTVSGVGQAPVELRVPVSNIPPQATRNITYVRNLDAESEVIDVAFSPDQPSTFSNSVPMTVYDSLGNAHALTQYYVKRPGEADSSVWYVHYALDDQVLADHQELRFTPNGVLEGAPAPTIVTLAFDNPGGDDSPAAELEITLDYTGTTQFGSPFTQNFAQDGYGSGEFVSIAVSKDGRVQAAYTNGEVQNIGSLVLANFNNVNGLKAVGGNAWTESPESGQAILGQPGTNGLATIMGQAIEASNVDMSQELVNMIIAQRTYQANAQSIKTQDQILQTLMQMR